MIVNAKDILLSGNPGTLPNLGGALLSWFQPMTFTRISKTITNFSVVETETPILTMGVRQPLSPQRLAMKPEGQRAWRIETLHILPDVILNPDEVVVFKGIRYRVLAKLDWKEYGFVEFEITEDFTP